MTLGIVMKSFDMFLLVSYDSIIRCSQYSKITSLDQRRQYKKDFEKDFAEYKILHAHKQRISNLFTDLEIQLRQVSNNEQRKGVSHCC